VTEVEVGYHVRAALQGRGLATEAAAACRDYARDVLGVDRLIAIIGQRNRPSQRVAEKLGLVLEREMSTRAAGPAPAHLCRLTDPAPSAGRLVIIEAAVALDVSVDSNGDLRELPVDLSDFRSRTHPESDPVGATRCYSRLLAGQAILRLTCTNGCFCWSPPEGNAPVLSL
jgi:hypothetical protein